MERKATVLKRVIFSGLVGWVVLAVWTFAVNGIFGFKSRMDMKQIVNERQVYDVLKDNVVEPGRYMCNPEMTQTGFPDNQPAFSIQYAGFGHESAAQESVIHLVLALLASMTATWMLSMTSEGVLRSYAKRVLFFAAIGLFLAASSEMPKFGIGGYPLNNAFILAIHAIIQWTVVGLVVAWRMGLLPRKV